MKSLLVICPHPENTAPSQRLKYEQYFDHWRSNGYEVVVSPFMTRRFHSIVYQPGRVLDASIRRQAFTIIVTAITARRLVVLPPASRKATLTRWVCMSM